MSSSFTNLGLAALLSATAFALSPRQAPPNPTTCFNLEAIAAGQPFNGEWAYIIPNPAQNYTTGLQDSQASSTIFTLTDYTNSTSGALFAMNAPGTPARSVPLLPIGVASAPIAWFNMADAEAESATTSSLRCEALSGTNYLRCNGVEQFNFCTGSIYGSGVTDVPAGCARVNLKVVTTACPAVTSSSMTSNTTMSSTSMTMSTATPIVNATTTSAAPTNTVTLTPLPPTAPPTIGNWNLLGCANSPSGFIGWVQVASTPIMTDEYCTVSCTNYRYAGTNGANCYCATELQDVSTTTFPNSCTVPCPGNAAQSCGGVVPRNGTFPNNGTASALGNTKRQLDLQGLLLTSYVNLAYNAQPPMNVTIGDIIINIDIIVYVDVCDTCAGGLTTCTTTSTCTTSACGCPTETLPTIPLTTVTRTCNACGTSGGPSTITVTIPVNAVTTATATLPGGPVITGSPLGPGTTGGITVAPFVTTSRFVGEGRREVAAGGLVGAVAAGFLALLV